MSEDTLSNRLEADKQALLELLLAEQAAGVPQPPRPRIERIGAARAPLSAAQQRLWLLYELAPESTAYNLTSVLRCRGHLQPALLHRALQRIVQRHGILRTTFHRGDDAPFQIVHPTMAVPVQVEDLSDCPAARRDAEIQRHANDETAWRFDLTTGPAIRVRVLRFGDAEHVLLIAAHHMVYDGWSLGVFVNELAAFYAADAGGRPAALPAPELDYADYAIWESRQDHGPHLRYWQRQLADVANLELPADRRRPAAPSFQGAWEPFALPRGLTVRVRDLGRRHGATLFMTLLAAFQALLHRCSGQDDFAVGVPVANRHGSELEGVIGFFVNTLAMRADLAGDPTFAALLDRTRDTVADGFSHEAAPFNSVVQAIRPERRSFETPLVQVMFGLQNAPMGRLDLPGLQLEPLKADRRTAKFDLLFLVEETADGLQGEIEYATDLFDRETIVRLAGHFRVLLEAIVADPGQRVSALPLLTRQERARLLVDWNRTATAFPADATIHDLFNREALRRPTATAIEFLDERLSYAELQARADRLAHRLGALGVGPGQRVALIAERSVELIVALLAILKAGGAYVPLSPDDPDARLALLLWDVTPCVVLTQSRLAARLPRGGCPVLCLDADTAPDGGPNGGPNGGLGDVRRPATTADDTAYVIYTSGSTGAPKGVCVGHRSVVRLVKDTDYAAFGPDEVFLQLAPLAFDASTFEIWGALLNGGTLAMAPPDSPSLAEIGRCIRRHRVNTLWLTAGLFNVMVDEQLADLAPLRQLLVGGDVLSVPHVRKALRALPDCRLINGYGPTENTTFTCCHPITDLEQPGASVPIGRPIANTRVYILDRHLRPTPIGIPGELCVSGAGLAQSYFNRPDLTAERFVANPFANDPHAGNPDAGDPDPRLYRTGDICRYRPDGTIEFLGRRDQQVKIRGFRVEPGEVEAVLATHPAVAAAVVVAVAGRLVGYVVPGGGIPEGAATPDQATGAALRAWLAQRLPGYMIPADMVMLERLPLNANGKVDRHLLPPPQAGAVNEAPGSLTPTEEIIAGIWAKVLDRPAVGGGDNFFELGGHSLLATQVISRLRAAFEVELPLRALFEAPTVAAFARLVEAARRGATPQPTPIRPRIDTALPALSFAQERLWFLDQLEPGNPYYVVPLALRLRGPLDVMALERGLADIARRHAVLRTTFPAVDGRPVQAIGEATGVALPVEDLRDLPPDARAAEAERLTLEEARRPFDLTRGPLLRARMLRVADDEHILLLTIHHIVADGWSLGVLVNELAPLYRAHAAGVAPSLPALPIQYADFAAWQRDWLRDAVLETQLGYWRRQLHDAPPVLDLPTDRPRPAAQSYRGGSVGFRLPAEVADGLHRLTRRDGATLFMTLLAGFAALLHRYSGQDDLVIGSPIANRNRIEIEPLVGFFVNTLALRIDLRGNPDFATLLRRVRRTALDAYAHQDLPFERLVDELQPERDLSLNPLFQVMFTLQNAPLGRLELAGVTAELLAIPHQAALFDLVLDMWEVDGTLYGTLAASADLFDDAGIRRIVDNLQTLLAAVAADAATPLDELPLLSAQDQAALLRMGAGPRRDYPVTRTLHALFADAAARHAERIAATHNRRQITYGELDAAANRIARRLRRMGVAANGFVALLDERGINLLAAMLGTLKAGAAFLPLDPAYPAERLRHMLTDFAAPVLISRGVYLAALPAGAFSGQTLLLDMDDGEASEWGGEPATPPPPTGTGGDLAYMLYTSGSTGLPKGALVRHGGAVNHICAEIELLGCDQDTAFLQSAPASSDISVWQFLMPVLTGGRTVIADTATVCDGAELLRLIRAERISLIELVPVVMKELLDAAGSLPAEARALPHLRCAMVTGEAVVPALVNQWIAAYPAVPLVNAYGPTEAADDICQAVFTHPIGSHRRTVPIGRPLANLTLYVLDRNLRLVPVGVPGEICVAGIGVGAGYWRNAARTRESFVANPYAVAGTGSGAGAGVVLYRTGDVGRWLADGTLECLDRIDHQVKLRGFRIEPGEIEAVLSTHPAVREALVAVRENAAGEKLLAGYVVPDLEAPAVAAQVRDLQREQIGLWQDLHEDSYREELLRGDATFNVIGWDSNYTGEPLPEVDMREYVGFTVERIRALRPRRVLELGCGTGLIMFGLLSHCTAYAGSDLSQVAVRRLVALRDDPALRSRIPGLDRAELQCRRADDCNWIARGGHDTVVLASVVQYFPGIEYLLSVLDGIFGRALAPGGSVFVGDVRSLPLLEAFHASVQLHKADAADSAAALADRVRQRLAREQELAIDPVFFLALRQRYPAIRTIEILPKRGTAANEMTRFRYDVLIRTAGEAARPDDLAWQDWDPARHDIAALRQTLGDRRPAVLALRRVANARVAEALAVSRHVLRGPRDARTDMIRRLAAAATRGLEPEVLWRLARDCGYRADLSLAAGHPDGSFDTVFRRLDGDAPPPLSWHGTDAPRPWWRHANNPVQEKLAHRLAPQLREFLKAGLPHYMVPASFTVLGSVPTSPAGKADREALPAPDLSGAIAEGGYVAPRTAEEQALARIWAEILALPRIGIHNNFFELGGHSLKATQVVSRIRRDLGAEVALRDLFNLPTIAELAARLTRGSAATVTPILHLPDADDHPLSHAQRRLWVLSHLDGGSTAYNMPLALQIDGAINGAAFQAAYARLVSRHEAMRTRFVVVDGTPRQRIGAGSAIVVTDLTAMPDPEAAAREIARRDAAAPFALDLGAVRATLLRLAADRHVLLLTMHHIVSDDWSLAVLVQDFVGLYTALSRGAEADLPPLRIQYRDFAGWQNARLAGPDAAAHRDYWHGKLTGELPVLQLPTDLPRPAVKTWRGLTLGCRLDGPELAALATLARQRNASLFMVLVAVVKALLARYTGQEDILIGFPIAGRDHPDLESQVGLYVNTLPLRDTVRGDAPFLDLLDAVRTTATEAYEHQAWPLDLLVDELDLPRDVGRSPMFDVIVVMQNAGAPSPTIAGLAVHPFVRRYELCKFDLSFTFEERDDALQLDITYNTDLFLPARIRRMAEHFRNLVAAILADPGTAVGRLRLLSATERQRLLALASRPAPLAIPLAPPLPAPADTLVGRFEELAARAATDVALVLPESDGAARQTLDYAALNVRANQVAHALRRRGVGPDVPVALCLPRTPDLVAAIIGILKAGGAYLPLDTAHPTDRLRFMAEDAGAAAVVTEASLAARFENLGIPVISVDRDRAVLAAEPTVNPAPVAGPDSLAYVIYTSGSTGRPKGVAVTHRNVVRLFSASEALFDFDRRDVWTLFHSCAFDFSVWELWGALLHGGRLVIVPHAMSRAPADFLRLLERERVTVLSQTPSAFRQLAQADTDADAAADRHRALRLVIFGGEALDLGSLRPWFDRHGDAHPRLVNMYGITETTVHVTWRPLTRADADAQASLIGRPLPDLTLAILDPYGEPVPDGVAGELYVGGAGVARGYLNRPDLTAERFVADPSGADPQARFYRTGDLGRLRLDGDIEYLGRIDQQVQIRGFRIEPGEIEAALRALPGVRDAVVLADGRDEHKRLVGYFIPATDAAAPDTASNIASLRSALRARLPEHMVPAQLIAVEAFPLTVNGKLDRAALPLAEDRSRSLEAPYAAPEGALEQQIAAAFRSALGIQQVGLNDNFFDLGANSLLLVQVHRVLAEALDRDLTVISLFQYPTVAALAAHLGADRGADRGAPSSAAAPPAAVPPDDRGLQRRAARDRRRALRR